MIVDRERGRSEADKNAKTQVNAPEDNLNNLFFVLIPNIINTTPSSQVLLASTLSSPVQNSSIPVAASIYKYTVTHRKAIMSEATTMSPSADFPRSIDEKKVGFIDLPRELRDQIYKFALVEPRTVRGFSHPQEICLSHNTDGRGGCDTTHAYHSNGRENFQALVQVSHMVRREAIEMLSKNVKLSCWMPLSGYGKDRIRVQQVDGCVCPVLLRHGTKLHVRRGDQVVPQAFDIAIVDGVWQVKPDGHGVPLKIVKDWIQTLQLLLESYDVQGGFSKEKPMVLRKCLVRADRVINKARKSSRRR